MKTLQGTVTSLKTTNTARVKVERSWQHPLYKKFVKRSKNYACHFEGITLAEGDKVSIVECRPLSRTKHFTVSAKVEVAQ